MLSIRLAFTFFIGFNNNYDLQSDSADLISFAKKSLTGDFNFDYGRFIASPGFPIFAALHMYLFDKYWNIFLVISQLIISSISGIFIYKTSKILFVKERVAITATIIFCLNPFTFWYVNTFCQETLFQSLFICSIYYLLEYCWFKQIKSLIICAITFSLAYLTKSHVLLFSIFIPLIFILTTQSYPTAIKSTLIFATICITFSLPYGLYHHFKNHSYVISSNGSGILFYLGNTNAGYISIVNVPEQNSADFYKMKDITNTAGYFNGDQKRYDSLMLLPQPKKQAAFFNEAYTWMKNNKAKVLKIKIYDLVYFLIPGVSIRHYKFQEWFFSFLISFPIYIFGYAGILICLRSNFYSHSYILALFLTMLLFSTVFYVQNRFRTITIEPFYIVYASFALDQLIIRFKRK